MEILVNKKGRKNVRYYDDSDKIQEYADNVENGTLLFRTDDIVKMEILKHDPLNENFKDSTDVDK